jgi:hypothetical protein
MALSLLCAGTVLADVTAWAENLRVTSVAPGGFGQLQVRLALSSSRVRIPHPEFAVLSARVALMDGPICCFTGEVIEAAQVLDRQGEGVELVAQGGAGSLADDPLDTSYASATAQSILIDQLTRRSAYTPLDLDTSAILPANPAATFSPVFDGRTFEDVLHEVCDLLGDYVWGVWDHPTHRDRFGLPAWQLAAHPRDVTTPTYLASLGDVVAWRVAPAATRAYNGVTLHYLDPSNGPGSVSVTDPRLNMNLSQGTAPFRFRRFRRDMGNRVLTSVQATALANQYLASFENVSNVISVTLGAVRDAQGAPIPLWRVRADRNIAIPELLPRAASFAAIAGLLPGSNLFYIRQADYREQSNQAPTLTLLLDQVADFAEADLTRQRYEEILRQRSKRTAPTVAPAGLAVKGFWSVRWGSTSGAGNVWGGPLQFPAVFAATPSGVTFTALASSNVASGPTIDNLTMWGCDVSVTSAGSGAGYWVGTYVAQ